LNLEVHVHDVSRLVRETGSWKAAVVGFSSGAITALAFASRYPELTSTVVLVGAATLTSEARAEFKRRLSERLDSVTASRLAELGTQPDTDERLEVQAALVMQAYLVDPVSLPEHVWVDARGHQETWQDMLRLQESGEHPRRFRSIGCPLLMIHGTEDPHPGEMIRRSLHAVVPQLEYNELVACGHYPWLERAGREKFYAVLERWLKNHTTA
jgi:pimeloyl-ACP methyl ester carboxylesterase